MPSSRSLLILSFSPIRSDARVLKQVRHFSRTFAVTTCGFGPAPDGVVRHIRIPDGIPAQNLHGRFITLKLYRAAYWALGAVAWCHRHLVRGSWDAVLANDVETVPLALRLRPAYGVHADLHEYTPRLHEHDPAWKRRITPFYHWLCRSYVSRAGSWTTVSDGLAGEYRKDFGFLPQVVINAAPLAALEPGAVHDPIRLVHSGACLRKRHLLTLIDAVELTPARVTLDFFLTPNDPEYLAQLIARAATVPGVTVHDPVDYDRLIATLNDFDVGVMVLPPVTFSYRWALPNKIFDYVQARLGIIVGPSVEMARYVENYRLGFVTEDFSAEALAELLARLSPRAVAELKENAHSAAEELSAERQSGIWDRAIETLFASGRR